MRVRLILQGYDGKLVLPSSYNYLVQSALYNNISRELAKFLHNHGFLFGKRRFKMFTFSRLEGRYVLDRGMGTFTYLGQVSLHVSSPIERFVKDLANEIVRKGYITLGKQRVRVLEMAFAASPHLKGEMKIRMLSPLTVYSTLLTLEGKRKTYYYAPFENEFSKLVDLNAKKKHFILHRRKIRSEITLKPLKVKEVILKYKDTVVKGWVGSFLLKGPKSLIRTVYDTGLGSKNPQGFGMFEVL